MAVPLLPDVPDAPCLSLDVVTMQAGVILLKARTTSDRVSCPACRTIARRVHSRYTRRLLDLPWQGYSVQIELTCRKLFCLNRDCPRRIFTEPLPTVAQPYARKTQRLEDALCELTYLVGAEAATRIAAAFGLTVSPDALLDAVRKETCSCFETPRVLGVDDFAFRRGHRYGTILVDLERHRPVDLLPDREAHTVAAWLRAHPGVQIISRDRGTAYKEGASLGAPSALQVADRFHLLKNLLEAMERQVAPYRRQLQEIAGQMPPTEASAAGAANPAAQPQGVPLTQLTQRQQALHERRDGQQARRRDGYDRACALRQEGWTLGAIAQEIGISQRTVQRFLRAEAFPERSPRSGQPKRTDAFAGYLRQRLDQGCRNVAQLCREIRERGYQGGYDNVYAAVREIRGPGSRNGKRPTGRSPAGSRVGPQASSRAVALSSRNVAWWLTEYYSSQPEVAAYQQRFVECVREQVPVLKEAASLAKRFIETMKDRQVAALDPWLEAACQSSSKEMRLFALGLRQDEAAVRNAVALDWSNGQVEGQVNRLKFIKRSMYGAGSFALLKARVLHRPAVSVA